MSKMKPIILIIVLALGLWGADEVLKIKDGLEGENTNILEMPNTTENTNTSEIPNVETDKNVSEVQDDNKAKEETEKVEESKVLEVNDETFEKEVLQSEKLVLIDFYATWCRPCQVLSPRVEEVAKENEDIKVVKIDVDIATKTASAYGITSIPTLVVIQNGEVKNGVAGAVSKEYINQMILSVSN